MSTDPLGFLDEPPLRSTAVPRPKIAAKPAIARPVLIAGAIGIVIAIFLSVFLFGHLGAFDPQYKTVIREWLRTHTNDGWWEEVKWDDTLDQQLERQAKAWRELDEQAGIKPKPVTGNEWHAVAGKPRNVQLTLRFHNNAGATEISTWLFYFRWDGDVCSVLDVAR